MRSGGITPFGRSEESFVMVRKSIGEILAATITGLVLTDPLRQPRRDGHRAGRLVVSRLRT